MSGVVDDTTEEDPGNDVSEVARRAYSAEEIRAGSVLDESGQREEEDYRVSRAFKARSAQDRAVLAARTRFMGLLQPTNAEAGRAPTEGCLRHARDSEFTIVNYDVDDDDVDRPPPQGPVLPMGARRHPPILDPRDNPFIPQL